MLLGSIWESATQLCMDYNCILWFITSLIWDSLLWLILQKFLFNEVFWDLVTSCVVKWLMTVLFSVNWFSNFEIQFLRRFTYKPFSDVAGFTALLAELAFCLSISPLYNICCTFFYDDRIIINSFIFRVISLRASH